MLNKILFSLFVLLISACSKSTIVVMNTQREEINAYLEDKNLSAIMTMLEQKPEITNLKSYYDSSGNNILHLIIEKKDIEALKNISINHKYSLPYNRYNDLYDTPLNLAISTGQCNMAEILLIKGANPLFIPKDHPTALVQTILEKKYPCEESILIHSHKALNQFGFNDWQAIHYAAYTNNIKALEIMMPYEPEFENFVPIDLGVPFYSQDMILGVGDINPFQITIIKGHLEAAQLLLKVHPAYAKQTTSNGTTNQELAEMSKSVAMIAWVETTDPNYVPRKKPKISVDDEEKTPVFQEGMNNISKTKNPPKKVTKKTTSKKK